MEGRSGLEIAVCIHGNMDDIYSYEGGEHPPGKTGDKNTSQKKVLGKSNDLGQLEEERFRRKPDKGE